MPTGKTCQEIADELRQLENEEVLLESKFDVAVEKLRIALDAYTLAVAEESKWRMALMGNRNKQLELHGKGNEQGCNFTKN